MSKIPIFIITFERLEVLKDTLDSYNKCICTPCDIVIHDNGSNFPATVDYLKILERNNVKVYWDKEVNERITKTYHPLDRVYNSIKDYFNGRVSCPYIVTDCDYALDCDGDILTVFEHLLNKYPHIDAVGPEMILDDIPLDYPQRDRVLNHYVHKDILNKMKAPIELGYFGAKAIQGHRFWFESNFGMYRESVKFTGNRQWGYRIFKPYMMRHLAWYVTDENITPDGEYYLKRAFDGPGGCTQW